MPVSGSPKENIHSELHRFKHGQLHSGSHRGPIVKSRPQAIAIALSEARKRGRLHRDMGGLIPGMSAPQAAQQASSTPQAGLAGSGGMMPMQPSSSLNPNWSENATGIGFGGALLGGSPNVALQPADQQSPSHPANPPAMSGLAGSAMGALSSPMPPPNPPAMSGLAGSAMGQPQPNSISPPAMNQMPPSPPATQTQPNPLSQFLPNYGQQSSNPGGNAGFENWFNRFNPAFAASLRARAQGRQFGGLTKAPNPSWTVRNEARSMLHSGPISSIVPGRTDRHNVNVKSGSYVMPADAVSHLGQNNTKAGQAILGHMFGSAGPYGIGKDMAARHGPGAPKPPGMQKTPMPHMPSFGKGSGFQSAGGGKGDHAGEPVPIVVAGGEFTVPPEAVAAIGGGDIKRGHKVLDQWVLSIRKKHIATLKGLPPPAKA